MNKPNADLQTIVCNYEADDARVRAARLTAEQTHAAHAAPWKSLLDGVSARLREAQHYLAYYTSKNKGGRPNRARARPELQGFFEEYRVVLLRLRGVLQFKVAVPPDPETHDTPLRWSTLMTEKEMTTLKRLFKAVPKKDVEKYVRKPETGGDA